MFVFLRSVIPTVELTIQQRHGLGFDLFLVLIVS
jgi:hypothetical protein